MSLLQPRVPEPPRPNTPHASSRDAVVTSAPRRDVTASSTPLSLGTKHIPWAPTSHQPPAVCDRAHTGLFSTLCRDTTREKEGRRVPAWSCSSRRSPGGLAVGAVRGSDAEGTAGARQHHSHPKPGLPARSQEAPSGLTTRAEKKDLFLPEPTGEKSRLLKRERLHGNRGSKEESEEGPEGRR